MLLKIEIKHAYVLVVNSTVIKFIYRSAKRFNHCSHMTYEFVYCGH